MQTTFEEHLTTEQRAFLVTLRVIEESVPLQEQFYRGRGRIPYQDLPFFRAFIGKSFLQIPQTLNIMVRRHSQDRIVGHILRDATAIEAREKPVNTKREVAQQVKERRKRGRPGKGESKVNKKANRLAPQARQKASVALGALNTICCWGCKRNSQGNVSFW